MVHDTLTLATSLYHTLFVHTIDYSIGVMRVEHTPDFELLKYIPYLTLTDKLLDRSWDKYLISQICCKVASLHDNHGHFIRWIKLILRGHVTAGMVVTWQQFVTDRGSSYPWLRLMAGWRVLIFMDSQNLRRHILSSRAITLTSSILIGCSWSPTAVLGRLSSLSPGYGQFHRYTAQGIPVTGFHRRHHTFCDQVFCLWGGPGWSTGCWGLVVSPNSMVFSCDQAALQMVFSVCPSICPSVCHTFLTMFPSSYHHEIFRSYYQWPK